MSDTASPSKSGWVTAVKTNSNNDNAATKDETKNNDDVEVADQDFTSDGCEDGVCEISYPSLIRGQKPVPLSNKKKPEVMASKSGHLLLKGKFVKSSARFLFELDSLSEDVQFYGPKNRIVGSFNLEGATIDGEDRKKNGEEKYRITVKTKKGRKYVLTAETKADRDEWKKSFEVARDRAVDSQSLLKEWKKQDGFIKDFLPTQGLEKTTSSDSVSSEVDIATETGEQPDFFSLSVQNLDAKSVELKSILTERLNLVVLLRHFGCIMCRKAISRVLNIRERLEKLNINLIAIGNGSVAAAKTFAKEFNLEVKNLFTDPKKEVYKAFSCNYGVRYVLNKRVIENIRKAHAEGFRQTLGLTGDKGDDFQLGGHFLVAGQTGEVVHKQIERIAGMEADLEAIIEDALYYLEDSDTWTSRPPVFDKWSEVVEPQSQKMVNIDPSTNPLLGREGVVEYQFEFGKGPVPENPVPVALPITTKYYAENFLNKPHINYLSSEADSDTKTGPVCISMEKWGAPKLVDRKSIVRMSSGDMRVLVPSEHATCEKDMLKYIRSVYPVLETSNLQICENEKLCEELASYEQKMTVKKYKFGVLYVRDGQKTEDEMYSNCTNSPEFEEFMNIIGRKITLKGFSGYRGGLDTKNDSTGTHAYCGIYKDFQIMYHVQTLLPFQDNDLQRIERKRHLGNDVVIIIFRDGNQPFDPFQISSHFNHVFVVVTPEKVNGKTNYRVAVAVKGEVRPFKPYLPNPALFSNMEQFKDFILSKCINGEANTLLSKDFQRREQRTRKEVLKELVSNYSKK